MSTANLDQIRNTLPAGDYSRLVDSLTLPGRLAPERIWCDLLDSDSPEIHETAALMLDSAMYLETYGEALVWAVFNATTEVMLENTQGNTRGHADWFVQHSTRVAGVLLVAMVDAGMIVAETQPSKFKKGRCSK